MAVVIEIGEVAQESQKQFPQRIRVVRIKNAQFLLNVDVLDLGIRVELLWVQSMQARDNWWGCTT